MKQTVNFQTFRDAFFECNRGEQFTYAALELIFDHLEQYENDCGVELELDPVAICCDYQEADAEELVNYYPIFEVDAIPNDPQEVIEAIQDYLENETIFVGLTDSNNFVFRQF
jgi:hypothetical protein